MGGGWEWWGGGGGCLQGGPLLHPFTADGALTPDFTTCHAVTALCPPPGAVSMDSRQKPTSANRAGKMFEGNTTTEVSEANVYPNTLYQMFKLFLQVAL